MNGELEKMGDTDKSVKEGPPVYVPYATLLSALETLKTNGIPQSGVLDKSIWETQSGAVQAQLILAFKFLGLIDDNRKVLPFLPTLLQSQGDERIAALRKIVEDSYRRIIDLGLATISPAQLDEAFKAYGIDGSTKDRAKRFFIKACGELGIPIAKRFIDKTRAVAPRKKRPSVPRRDPGPSSDHADQPNQGIRAGAWEERILEKFPAFDPTWGEELQKKWFEGLERLMASKPK